MKRSLFPLFALLALAGCLPALELERDPPVIGATTEAGVVPFGSFETYFERSGVRAGAPVVMIHGIGGGSSLFQYRLNVPAFASAGYDVHAIDLLGFGRSSRPVMRYTQDLHVEQITAYLEGLERPAALVANGLSAAYAIRLAVERPDLVESLVLIVPTGFDRLARPAGEDREAAFETFTGVLGSLVYLFLLEEGAQRFFLLDAYAGPESLTPEVLETYDRNLRATNAQWVIFSFVSGNLDQDVSSFWPRVEQPAMIVWGVDASTTPIGDAEAFLSTRPDTRFLPLQGAKLLPNEDRADAFNREALAFLAAANR